ncbi:hypothetical protein E4U41_001147, partial [Claviceps citrina]
MNVQTLRSTCARAKPTGLPKTGLALKNYFRDFSASGWLGEDDTAPPPATPHPVLGPSARQRSRAATSEINSFVRSRDNTSAGAGAAAAARPLVSHLASTSQLKVIDVR